MKTPARLASLVALASCASCAAPSARSGAPPSPPDEQWVTVLVGQRELDDDYDPVEDQLVVGAEYARQGVGDLVGFELGVLSSADEDEIGSVDVEGSTGEVYAGLHKCFGDDVVRPYLGAGLSFIRSEVDVDGVGDDDDDSIAGYAHGGVRVLLGESFYLGADVRWLFGSDLELYGEDTDADYGQAAITFGWTF